MLNTSFTEAIKSPHKSWWCRIVTSDKCKRCAAEAYLRIA